MSTCRLEWCGYCYSGLRGRAVYRGHFGWRAHRRRRRKWRCYVRKPQAEDRGEVSALRFVAESEWTAAYPHLFEWLVEDRWDDGTVRETGTVLLFTEAGRWKACLNDRALGRSCFLSGETPEGLLQSLDDGLGSSGLEWRAKPPRAPSKGSGGK